ncbi:MAG TPA: cupin domain-containing protein [Candidatus Bathyarchaeia archaeon]|nr:cupin domain-containing protein [Candidatus Bathyarchaeia archaeon]
MNPFFGNIEKKTLNNSYFRQVIFTGAHSQLVLMCLKPGEEIGFEVHEKVDQFFRLEQGEAKFIIDGKDFLAKDADAVIVPAGANHNVINTSTDKELKLYTIYSPANHPEGTVHKTLKEAQEAEKHHHE